jgi:xylan 1,4-beta-xylosidase
MGEWGIARPGLHAFAFLHKLGERRVQASDGPVLATRKADGSIAALVWNLIPTQPRNRFTGGNGGRGASQQSQGSKKTFRLSLNGLEGRKTVEVSHVSPDDGSAVPAWKKMGSPEYPTHEQIVQLRAAAELLKPERHELAAGEPAEFSITLPPNGVALLEFAR